MDGMDKKKGLRDVEVFWGRGRATSLPVPESAPLGGIQKIRPYLPYRPYEIVTI